MGFFDSVSEAGRGFGAAARDAARTAKLNVRLRTLDENLAKEFQALGRRYYEQHKDEESAENRRIREIYTEIADTKDELADIRGEIVCPDCGEYVPKNSKFCPNCGADLNVFAEADDETVEETVDEEDAFEDEKTETDDGETKTDDTKETEEKAE